VTGSQDQIIQLLLEIRDDIRQLDRKLDALGRKLDNHFADLSAELSLSSFVRTLSDKLPNHS
jgi:hypothetical protein